MAQPGAPRLILASGSAARRALLAAAGVDAETIRPDVDETAVKQAFRAEGAEAVALRLAAAKAGAVAEGSPGTVVIGADQLLVQGDRWFDKPRTLAEARGHLLALRGGDHVLVTAVVLVRDGAVAWRHVAQPRLTMRGFSDAFLDAYLAAEGTALLDCVGAYRFEGLGAQLFDRMEGEQSAILGLPMLPLLAGLRAAGLVRR